MIELMLKNTIFGSGPRTSSTPKVRGILDAGRPKIMDGDYVWQDEATENSIQNALSALISPTGSGKQPIISASAYGQLHQHKRRALITVPSLGLGTEYLKAHIQRKSGDIYAYDIQPDRDFRSVSNGYHAIRKGTIRGLRDFLLGGELAIAVATHQTLVGVWQTLKTPEERRLALQNLWIAMDEGHHISGVLSEEEAMGDEEERKLIFDNRTYLGDLTEYLCEKQKSLNSGIMPATATPFRGDKVPLFYAAVESLLSKYTRHFLDHWEFLGFKSFTQECIGYDDPIETLQELVTPEECALVYLSSKRGGYRRGNPDFVEDMKTMLLSNGLRVIDLITPATQEENMELLRKDNLSYKKGADRRYDVILAVNMLREGSDYLPISRIYDFAPSDSLNRTVQTIGRTMRKDVTPDGRVRKDSVKYSAFFYNLQEYDSEERVRTLVCDRINTGFTGMLGVFSLFDDTRMPSPRKHEKYPLEEDEAYQIPTLPETHRRLEEVFGVLAPKALETFSMKIIMKMSVADAIFATVREIRQSVEGRPSWSGSLEEAGAVLKGVLPLVSAGKKGCTFRTLVSPLPASLEEQGLLAEQIREAGFDITTVRHGFNTLFGADADANKFELLNSTLNKLATTTKTMQTKDRQAAAALFSTNSKDKGKEGRKALNSRRSKFRARGVGTAITPTVGEPKL